MLKLGISLAETEMTLTAFDRLVAGGALAFLLLAVIGGLFLSRQAIAADGQTPFVNPLTPKAPPRAAKAKSVIFLFMYGGPSHIDTFDYKPTLYRLDGQTIQVQTFGRGASGLT